MTPVIVDIEGTPHHYSSGQDVSFAVFAKYINGKYFVLASSEGDLFNPNNLNHKIYRKDKERGRLFWTLKRCSKECYRQYCTFLRSKNITPLRLAQRRFQYDVL